MAVSLLKGSKVSLVKAAEDAGIVSLVKVAVGLGWDVNRYDSGEVFDLDVSAFCTNASGHCGSDGDFVFYNNKKHSSGSVVHMGDNRTGAGDGDDETVIVDLNAVPESIQKIAFTATIHEADKRNQNFGQVENAYIRVMDANTGTELIRYDLHEDFSLETSVVAGELYRYNGEWKFNAIGSGFQGGLSVLCANFGISLE